MAGRLYDIIANTPSEGMLSPVRGIFTADEIARIHCERNAAWFVESANFLSDPSLVLVKALLNEREVRLPVAPVAPATPGSPFSGWTDWAALKNHYAPILAQ